MATSDVMTLFKKLSGRRDLFYQNGLDNGALRFLNKAQRKLDSMTEGHNVVHISSIAEGEWYKEMNYVEAIEDIWVSNSDGRSQLIKKDMDWIRTYYAKDISDIDGGTPVYWNIARGELHPDTRLTSTELSALTDADLLFDYSGTGSYDAFGKKFLMWMPPADDTYTLRITGRFKSQTLAYDADTVDVETYWTEQHDLLLVATALMLVELFYRNTQGYQDYKAAVYELFDDIDKDAASREIVNKTERRGNIMLYLEDMGR